MHNNKKGVRQMGKMPVMEKSTIIEQEYDDDGLVKNGIDHELQVYVENYKIVGCLDIRNCQARRLLGFVVQVCPGREIIKFGGK